MTTRYTPSECAPIWGTHESGMSQDELLAELLCAVADHRDAVQTGELSPAEGAAVDAALWAAGAKVAALADR